MSTLDNDDSYPNITDDFGAYQAGQLTQLNQADDQDPLTAAQ